MVATLCDTCKKPIPSTAPHFRVEREGTQVLSELSTYDICSPACLEDLAAQLQGQGRVAHG